MTIYTPASDSQIEASKMKLVYFSNEFPHDDLQDLLRRLYKHSNSRSHPILAQFIDDATIAIREEIRQLPASLKRLMPPLDTVLDLADHPALRKGPLGGSIDGVLLCMLELGTLIRYYEISSGGYDLPLGNTYLAGLGIGLLATAAVSLSQVLTDLPIAGAEVVRVAFRLGVVVDEISQNLEQRDPNSSPETWASVVTGVAVEDVQAELDSIHKTENTPRASQVFISALSQTSVTVSGPPSRLKRIFRLSEFFRGRKIVSLPVYGGLCHAEHIYNEKHVDEVISTQSMRQLNERLVPGIPIFSTSTGRPYVVGSARELFKQIIIEIMTQKIEWDRVVQGVIECAQSLSAPECQIFVFRLSLPIHDLLSTSAAVIPDTAMATEELIPWVSKTGIGSTAARGTKQSKLAIVGMSCRMPAGATDTEKFWQLLEQGLDVHRKIPADRFDVDSHYDPTGKRVNTSMTPYGCFIEEPGLFDAPFFNMSPREAQQTDPMQRLALVTAYEALERAGYVANRTASTNLHRIGTFYGQASDDYREVNTAQEISTYFIPGGCRAFGPGRINYFFKFSGPSFSCDTACSSSLATIQAACTSLWNGDTDMVVAGGMNVLTNSDAFAGLSNGHFLSKTPNACKTWDCEADGYCRADGVASIVLKRFDDAVGDNDNILGVILGTATNHSAEAVSITHPHAGAQSYLYQQVLRSAGVDPLDVSYVEMHGTGTQAGDAVEIKSITDVFAPNSTKRRTAKQPLHIGAVKANVGHGEAVAGVTALLKVLLMYQNNAIPPHIGIKNSLNPTFPKDLDRRNVHIPFEKTAWPRLEAKSRYAVVNNFSAAGGNTTLVLEDAPQRETPVTTDPRRTHAVLVSAKSKISLKGNLERLLAYLDAHPEVSLADLSYTTTARRYHHNHRVAIAISDVTQARKKLGSSLESVDSHKPIPATGPPPVAFAFTGQGASHKSMNLELFHQAPVFRSQILYLDSLAQRQGFPSFVPAIDGSFHKDHAHSPVVTQMALVALEMALARYWDSLGVRPSVVVGHSLGEYAALYVAGVLSASDALALVGYRAKLLEQKCQAGSHQMVAVRASLPEIEQSAGGLAFEVACINGPKETVLSGSRAEMDAIVPPLEAMGYRCYRLDVAFAFHSAQTDLILDDFESLAQSGILFQPPRLPVISPLLGKVIFADKTVNAQYVRRATRETVNFLAALQAAQRISTVDEETVWVELGPHPVCTGFVKATIPTLNAAVPSLNRTEDNWTTLAQSLTSLHSAGVPLDWNEFHRPFEPALRLLDLPTYAWNDKNYWIMYNGDWALTKGNTFYDAEKAAKAGLAPSTGVQSNLQTSTVQRIIEESFRKPAGKVVMQSDLMQPEFLAAANGHRMNNCGVVTSSIHADIAYTLGKYLYQNLVPGANAVHMNIANFHVVKGLVAQQDTGRPQCIRVSVETGDISSGQASLFWRNVLANGDIEEPFASAEIQYGDAAAWLESWIPQKHLVQGRIDALERLADEGIANRFSHRMAYLLFANNLVDYADKYRGMQSVILHELEATAAVTLTTQKGGVWTVPPYFIDSVAHLAGFVMNVSDAIDTKANYCVTPGWRSMRFARPLVAGAQYRSYVKMIPTAADATVYLGDVYILHDAEIIGLVQGIQFRRYPRILLNRFFSPPDLDSPPAAAAVAAPAALAPKPTPAALPVTSSPLPAPKAAAPAPAPEPGQAPAPTAAGESSDSVAAKAIALIAKEAALEHSDLTDDASFASLGVDSLMSLVISEKFREELGVSVSGSLFLEYPTIGDLRAWLLEYYN
ncbi:hypothetical protein EYZ11_007067 [Aspergillus tanneri]|uniref:Uncharacterized protein n=1 Tax=Aspergillus tanneri TaxID=1220188 RepID=A0A4S3JG96_9EURO|nr:hypothetical protein EYZ11_007067 [Aspergillus tanneri]